MKFISVRLFYTITARLNDHDKKMENNENNENNEK